MSLSYGVSELHEGTKDTPRSGLISGRLRKRKSRSESNDLPEGFFPLNQFCEDVVTAGLPVAKVRAGRFVLGKVVGVLGAAEVKREEGTVHAR